MKNCLIYHLGVVDYQKGLELQERLLQMRKENSTPDVLLLLEHPSVITLGRSGRFENILVSRETLAEEGIPVFLTKRGGDITYHGPGQLVTYPILYLGGNNLAVSDYVWHLEEVVIRTLLDLGIVARRIAGVRGAWVGEEKICSLGVRVSGGVTTHGFALNVNTDLKYFSYIIPCGISGVRITSIARLLGHKVEMATVEEIALSHFLRAFNFMPVFEEESNLWLVKPSLIG